MYILMDIAHTATELFQSLPFGSGTVFRSTSHLRRHFLSSALAWRHTSSNCAIHKTFVVPAKWHCHFGYVNRSAYLLTFLTTDCHISLSVFCGCWCLTAATGIGECIGRQEITRQDGQSKRTCQQRFRRWWVLGFVYISLHCLQYSALRYYYYY